MKTRLNTNHRDLLKELAKNKIEIPESKKLLDEAYILADDLVRNQAIKQYPSKDMDILAKYGVLKETTDIRLLIIKENEDYDYYYFSVSRELRIPNHNNKYRSRTGAVTIFYKSKICEAVYKHGEILEMYHSKINDILSDYYCLIDNSKYYEEVVQVWKEADDLSPLIVPSAKLVSSDVKQRIRQDADSRIGETL